MNRQSYVVAVVLARGGSTRLPGKNLRPLMGQPLVSWAIRSALASRCDRVVLSTDCEDIAAAGTTAGAEVPFVRPAALSGNTPAEEVTRHAIEFLEARDGQRVDVVVTMQPTTPFLKSSDIDACLRLLEDNPSLESAFTVGPAHQRPEWMYVPQGDGLASKLQDGVTRGEAGVTQCLPPLYHPNGGAYASRRRLLMEDHALVAVNTGIVVMDRLHSVDIDEEIDFITAEAVARHLQSAPGGA